VLDIQAQGATGPSTTAVSAQPGGRRAERRAATKSQILEAAWAAVRSEGLAALSMRELAAAVGMRAPSLYQYFDSKLAIYDAMFGQGALEALEALRTAIEGKEGVEALRESGRAMVRFATDDPVRNQLLFQRTIPGFEPSAASYAPAVEMVRTVEVLMARAGIGDDDALDLWTALISGVTNQQLANDPGGVRWIRLWDRAVDMFLAEVHRAPRPVPPMQQES